MTGFTMLIIAAAILAVYQIVAVRLSRAVQPLRLMIVEEGEKLLAADDVPAETKKGVEAVLDWVFSPAIAWLVVVSFVWVSIAVMFRKATRFASDVPEHRRESLERVHRLGILCALGNSPAAFLCFVMIAIVGMMFSPIDRLLRNGMTALSQVTEKSERLAGH